MKLQSLSKRLEIRPKNNELFEQAFIHPSTGKKSYFKTLEFLGDAVYELLMRKFLYNSVSEKNESTLSTLRNYYSSRKFMAELSKVLGLDKKLKLGKCEKKEGRNKESILAAAFEAFLGALFLDKGFKSCEKFFDKFVKDYINTKDINLDPKVVLSNLYSQTNFYYRVLSKKGELHKPEYKVGLYLEKKLVSKGKGKSKKEAQRDAARKFLSSQQKL